MKEYGPSSTPAGGSGMFSMLGAAIGGAVDNKRLNEQYDSESEQVSNLLNEAKAEMESNPNYKAKDFVQSAILRGVLSRPEVKEFIAVVKQNEVDSRKKGISETAASLADESLGNSPEDINAGIIKRYSDVTEEELNTPQIKSLRTELWKRKQGVQQQPAQQPQAPQDTTTLDDAFRATDTDADKFNVGANSNTLNEEAVKAGSVIESSNMGVEPKIDEVAPVDEPQVASAGSWDDSIRSTIPEEYQAEYDDLKRMFDYNSDVEAFNKGLSSLRDAIRKDGNTKAAQDLQLEIAKLKKEISPLPLSDRQKELQGNTLRDEVVNYTKNTKEYRAIGRALADIDSAFKEIGVEEGFWGDPTKAGGAIGIVGLGGKSFRNWVKTDFAKKVNPRLKDLLNRTIKEITGASMNESEAPRIEGSLGLNNRSTVDEFFVALKAKAQETWENLSMFESGVEKETFNAIKKANPLLFTSDKIPLSKEMRAAMGYSAGATAPTDPNRSKAIQVLKNSGIQNPTEDQINNLIKSGKLDQVAPAQTNTTANKPTLSDEDLINQELGL